VGFWLAKGRAHPALTPSAWRKEKYDALRHQSHFWGESIRSRIAQQVARIRHWKVQHGFYWQAPDVEADWFVDPPYEGKPGLQYRTHGSRNFDYGALAAWCIERRGQTIVCEAQGASWLPFRPFHTAAGMQGTKRTGISREAIWHRGGEVLDLFAAD